MYIHEQITNEKSLEKVLQQLRDSDNVFVLDLGHINNISSKAIQDLVETHIIAPERLYILLPEDSNILSIFRRESLFGLLNIFNNSKDLELVIDRQITPCQRSYFPGPVFKIGQDAQNELDRIAEVCTRTGKCSFSLGLRQEFLHRNFTLPATLTVTKVEGEWWIYEASLTQRPGTTENRPILYIIRTDVYGQALEVCQQILTLTPTGTLFGKERAKEFLYQLREENTPIIFINLNHCYSWDEEYARAYRKAKEYKKIYLVRADSMAIDFLFKTQGDIFYSDYEKAYTHAALLIKKQWRLSPNPDSDDFEPQSIVEISGYISEQDSEITEFSKKLMRILRRTIRKLHRMCIDIRELYRMEAKVREIFVCNINEWCRQHKVRRTNIVIIATLPRPDYTIQDVVADLYENGFFIVPTPEEAMSLLESYPHPHFITENSSSVSILRLEGNIIQDQELNTFRSEVTNLVHNALSATSDVNNVIRSPQQTVFFDFSTIPCVYAPVIQTILSVDSQNKNLSKILLVNEHLAELIRKLFGKEDPTASNIFCYGEKSTALSSHIRNILIVAPKKIAVEVIDYFQKIFQEIYRIPQAKHTQFRVRFHFDFERLPARLAHDNYDLLIFYGYTEENDRQKIQQFLTKYPQPVLELVQPSNWTELQPYQLEIDAPMNLIQDKISSLLWSNPSKYNEYRLLFLGQNWEKTGQSIQNCLQEEQWDLLKNFLPVVDGAWYEFILSQREDTSVSSTLPKLNLSNLTKNNLERIEFHPYRQWLRNFSFHYANNIISICQKVSDENAISSTLEVVSHYGNYPQNLWGLLPHSIRRSQNERWMSLEIIKNKLLSLMFRTPIFEVEYYLIILHTELSDLFEGRIWQAIRSLWEGSRQDIRYRSFEDPLLGMTQLILNWSNDQSIQQNQSWLSLMIGFSEDENGLKVTFLTDNIGAEPKLPESLFTALTDCQNRYKLDAQGRITPDGRILEIILQIKGRSSATKKSITIRKTTEE